MSDRDDAFLVAQDAERDGRWELAMQIRASVFDGNLTVDGCSYDVPWNRGAWNGSFVSLDGAATDDFTSDDVDAVLAYGDTDTYDIGSGTTAGIVRLKDGRFVSWESSYDVTGSGFHEDAYGGDAVVVKHERTWFDPWLEAPFVGDPPRVAITPWVGGSRITSALWIDAP